jgi:hypothetical protein
MLLLRLIEEQSVRRFHPSCFISLCSAGAIHCAVESV